MKNKLLVMALGAVGSLMLLAESASAGTVFVQGIPPSGNQDWPGSLGDSFLVGASDLLLTKAGVFDSDSNGLGLAITWEIWSGGSSGLHTLLHSLTFAAGTLNANPGVDSHIYQAVAPIVLLAGQSYTVVAYGYGPLELNYNENFSPNTPVIYASGGLTAGVGGYHNNPAANPDTFTWGPFSGGDNFGVASFEYETRFAVAAVPLPSSAVMGAGLLGLLALGRTIQRRRRRDIA